MATISMDLRMRVFEARESGETTAEVADRFEVSTAFVRRLMQRHRETGSLAPSSARRGPHPQLAEHTEHLQTLNAQNPDLTPAEIRDRLGLKVAAITVWRMLRRLGLTFKKSRFGPPNKTAPTFNKRGTSGLKPLLSKDRNV
jgi:transposase